MHRYFSGAQGAKDFSGFPLRILAAIALSGVWLSVSTAQVNSAAGAHQRESDRAAQVRALNNSVLQLHGQLQENPSSSGVRGQAANVLAQRAAALQALIEENPRSALSFAFSPELLAELAERFADSSTELESHITLSGPIQHWTEDYPDQRVSRESWHLNQDGQLLNLHFATAVPKGAESGATVTVVGVRSGREVAVRSASIVPRGGVAAVPGKYGSSRLPILRQTGWLVSALGVLICGLFFASVEFRARRPVGANYYFLRVPAIVGLSVLLVLSGSSVGFAQNLTCSSTGPQNVAVLLVSFPGVTPPANITQQSVYDMFFNPAGPSLDGYWREASYGQTSATGNVFGWYTLDSSLADCTRLDLLRDAAITAAAGSGVALKNYSRIFIVTTDFGCGWTGLSMGTCTNLASPNGNFVASVSFLNAIWQRSQIEGAENAAHEGGHNMGLGHAQSRTFGSEPLGALNAAGTVLEYGDPFSDMSASNSGHYAAPHKAEELNWIANGTNYQVVANNGSWTLEPLETNPAGLLALKIQRGSGNDAWLWVEYRQPVGIYESIWSPAGALIHYQDATTGTHTQLVDFTPGTSGMFDAALMPGSTWVDPYSNVSIGVQSASSAGLTVSVNYGAPSCAPAAPSVVVSPLDPSIYPGQSAIYSATVTNQDSSACSPSTINLNSTQPSGWVTSLSASAVTLGPGQSTSVQFGKGAPNGTAPGTYAVDLNASTTVSSSSALANATVVTAPPTSSMSVGVSIAGSNFSRPGVVPISVSVSNAGIPVSGASVTILVTSPTGSVARQSATTSSSGTVTWNYKLSQRSASGWYSVTASASLTSGSKKTASTQSAAGNIVNFQVQ